METSYPKWRRPLKNSRAVWGFGPAIVTILLGGPAFGQSPSKTITLEQATELALDRNHTLLANRTTISQSLAQEVSANVRPNPVVFGTFYYIPYKRPEAGWLNYFHDGSELDAGMTYTIERGAKRQNRYQVAKDVTSLTRSVVVDNERVLKFQVASLFVNAQLADSMFDLAQQNLTSFQTTVDTAESQFQAGGISENDYQKIRLQLLQFQADVQQAQLTKIQALSDLRQQLGYESVPPDYGISGTFDYQPQALNLQDLQAVAIRNRPDLRVAEQGIAVAKSQYSLAKANGKQDVGVSVNYAHNNGINNITVQLSIPLPIFDRNQGEIARTEVAINQARQQEAAARGQVLTDVKDAFEALQTADRVTQYFRNTYLEAAQRNGNISEFAYRRGAGTLLNFLDAERSYRATQLAYRQAIGAYLQALEQLRQAVGTRSLR